MGLRSRKKHLFFFCFQQKKPQTMICTLIEEGFIEQSDYKIDKHAFHRIKLNTVIKIFFISDHWFMIIVWCPVELV